MSRVILMRHAKSDWSAGLKDHKRPLNARGKRSAKALGHWMREKGYAPDLALVSTSTRTRETWEGLAFSGTDAEFRDTLYNASAETLLAAVAETETKSLLVIAHNPGIAIAAAYLCPRAPTHPRFQDYPTGATLVLDRQGDGWTVTDFVVPRDLLPEDSDAP